MHNIYKGVAYDTYMYICRIMQIVRDAKLSWFQCLIDIHRKTFAVVSLMQY